MNRFYKDKQQIINWLDTYEIKKYTLIPDDKYGFVVDVNGDVNLNSKDLIFIPVKFNKVIGDFFCNHNQLTSLDFCPKEVGENFYCNNNQLNSLEFCPEKVGEGFYCNNNQLNSLEFCPREVGDNFYFWNNPELKEVQNITEFKAIYLEHKRILAIVQLAKKLNNDLLGDSTKNRTKIKI